MRALIALDGSSVADVVLAVVAPWLRDSKARAELLTVMDASEIRETTAPGPLHELTPRGGDGGQLLNVPEPMPHFAEDRTQALARIHHDLQVRLEQLAAEHLAGVDYGVHVESAPKAAEAIIERARALDADAIVMGTHGRSGLRRVLMGSVAEAVLLASPVPVFLVRQDMRRIGARARGEAAQAV